MKTAMAILMMLMLVTGAEAGLSKWVGGVVYGNVGDPEIGSNTAADTAVKRMKSAQVEAAVAVKAAAAARVEAAEAIEMAKVEAAETIETIRTKAAVEVKAAHSEAAAASAVARREMARADVYRGVIAEQTQELADVCAANRRVQWRTAISAAAVALAVGVILGHSRYVRKPVKLLPGAKLGRLGRLFRRGDKPPTPDPDEEPVLVAHMGSGATTAPVE